jgi:hypothetical protein
MTRLLARIAAALAVLTGIAFVIAFTGNGAQAQSAPRYRFDPDWPKPLPNKWKMGGVTGLAVDRNDDVWVLNRPNDMRDLELEAEIGDADCCVRPPSMIHINKNGDVIGSFDPPQGHGMDVDSQGNVYIGSDTVRKYDPKSGKMLQAVQRAEPQPGARGEGDGPAAAPRQPGRGGPGPTGTFQQQGGGGGRGRGNADPAQAAALAAWQAKYPPTAPVIIGQVEEIRLDEPANEMYVADSSFGGRVMVFDLKTFTFKRGWGAYGKPLAQISTNPADRAYKPGGPMPKEFVGHLTLNFSNDGLVYAADRAANRIHVTTKQGKYVGKEFVIHPTTRGTTGGVAFSPDKEQRFLFISDLRNNHIWFLNREDGKILGQMGSLGENGGQFFGLHMIAVDSKGVIYTGEVFNGERVQRFLPVN